MSYVLLFSRCFFNRGFIGHTCTFINNSNDNNNNNNNNNNNITIIIIIIIITKLNSDYRNLSLYRNPRGSIETNAFTAPC